jgi:transcription-repair coupling factor (superfamily II helicase)
LAAKRLHAIQQYSEIGAGFAIAMRDLEIRGAGNLLGTEQSGHIAAIGYELYCQMLETAVRAAKQMPRKIDIHVDVDLPLRAYLPDEYVPDRRAKIDLYRRLTRLEKFEEIKEIKNEMIDRFGPPPPETKRLLKLAVVKLEAAVWQINTVFMEERFLGFRFDNKPRILTLASRLNGNLRIVDEQTAYMTLKSANYDSDKLLALVKSVLQAKP